MKPYDLHNHSDLSKDGQTPAEKLIDIAAIRGMRGLGISDHDEFQNKGLYNYAKTKGVRLALGPEITCHEAHIIGYNMSISGPDLEFLEDRFYEMRTTYFTVTLKYIEMFQKQGVDISLGALQNKYKRKTPQKMFVLKYIAEELKLFPSWADARRHLKRIGLYIGDEDGTRKINPTDIIELIHRAGGFAIWAHPFITPEEPRARFWKEFKAHGIDAVEANYPYKENGYKGDESNEELEQKARLICAELGIPVSGGSDSHYPLKTYSDLSPVYPGDFGIDEHEFEAVKQCFK